MPDAFEPRNLEGLKLDCPIIDVAPRQTKFSDYFEVEDIERIVDCKLDVLIRLGFRILRGDILNVARFGVWSYHHGDNEENRGAPAGFWEVMTESPITGSMLQQIGEKLDDGHILYQSYASTDPRSVRRNCNNVYWKSSEFVARCLRELHATGEAPKVSDSQEYLPYSHPLYQVPTNWKMAGMAGGLAIRYLRDKFRNLHKQEHWKLYYQIEKEATDESPPTLYRFKRLDPPKDRFWADPFPWYHDGKYYIFFEELMYQTNKGHISVIEIAPDGKVGPSQPVLTPDYHLSYRFSSSGRESCT